jgi:hypothetical protein
MKVRMTVPSILVIVAGLFIPFGAMAQQNQLKPDGTMWKSLEAAYPGMAGVTIKEAYVLGASQGLRVGAAAGYFAGRGDEKNDALGYIKPCIETGPCARIPVDTLLRPLTNKDVDEFGAGADKVQGMFTAHSSVLDVVHQMDKFYADYRNTPVCMITAVQEAIGSLRGMASSDEQLNEERNAALKGGCPAK